MHLFLVLTATEGVSPLDLNLNFFVSELFVIHEVMTYIEVFLNEPLESAHGSRALSMFTVCSHQLSGCITFS